MNDLGKFHLKHFFLLLLIIPFIADSQEVRGLKIFVDITAGTYLKFQKPIDGIEGTFRDKGYNYKNRSGGNALNIVLPTDRPLEPAEIEISEGGRNHLFYITPYPGKYDPNIDPPFDYIMDNVDKVKKFVRQAEEDRKNLASTAGGSTSPPVSTTAATVTSTAPDPPLIINTSSDDGYAEQIAIADRAFIDKDFNKAKLAYTEAYRIRLNEKYPLSRLQLITKLEEEAAAAGRLQQEKQRQIDAAYSAELQKADRYLLNGEYSLAREAYTKASEIKTDDPYPKTKINEIDKLVKDLLARQEEEKRKAEEERKRLAAQQELNNKYDAAVSRGDKAFNNHEYDVAKIAYNDALQIKPGEKYPKDKLNEIIEIKNASEAAATERLIREREKELLTKYNGFITQGDNAVKNKQFDAAKTAYQTALDLKPSENVAQAKLAELVDIIEKEKQALNERERIAREKEINEKYNTAIAKADKAYADKNYETAKTEYYNAQALKAGESYPQKQLTLIDRRLAEIATAKAREKEQEEVYDRAVTRADHAYSTKNFAEAKAAYNSALDAKPDDAYAKAKLAAINKQEAELVRQQQLAAEKALNDRFDAASAEGDKAFAANQLAAARDHYQRALEIIPDRLYPQNQIKLIDRKLFEQAEREKTAQFNSMISLGDEAFAAKSYNTAKDYYANALAIRPGESYPQRQIAIINDPGELERMVKREEFKQYNQYVDDGDRSFKAGKFEAARESYKKAMAIKADVPYLEHKMHQIDDAIAAANLSAKEKERMEAEKAKNEKFNQLIVNAGMAMDAGDFEKAKKALNEALALKPEDAAIREKLNYAEERIRRAEEEANAERLAKQREKELNERFDNLVAKADKAYKDKHYTEAKENYEQAILLKPDERKVRDRLESVNKEIAKAEDDTRAALAQKDAAEINRNYNAALERADKALDAKLYFEAKAAYTDALAIKPNESFPAARLQEIDKALAEINKARKVSDKPAEKSPAGAATSGSLTQQQTALPYNQAELYKRYNTINFREPPRGQKLTADAFFKEDTLKNHLISNSVIAKPPFLEISDTANDVVLTLQAIHFEGSRAYFKFRIRNYGKKEFLAGRMLLTWYRNDGTTLDYYGNYITSYPYVLPESEYYVVYVARAATLAPGERFEFMMEDRLKTTTLEIGISEKVYNSEFER